MNVIETVDLTKMYGTFTANNKINLKIKRGEIKAIVGENGAGKSTLMNMLYGLIPPTEGKILINNEEVSFKSPTDAIDLGIGMVHQHFKLVSSLTVYENIFLGVEENKVVKIGKKTFKIPIIDHQKEKRKIEELIKKAKFDININEKVGNLSVGAKQKVEILKMLFRNVDIIIFDEPTAVLTPQEIEDFLENIKEMKKDGKTIIIISHKLQEVMDVSDSITVLKKGEIVGEVLTKDTSKKELAQMMVGRDVLLTIERENTKIGNEVIYELKNLSTKNKDNVLVLNDVNLKLKKGEILGVAGVEGNGQTELGNVLTGMMNSVSGDVFLDGCKVTNKWPAELRHKGLGVIPEDRYIHGLNLDMSITKNMIAGAFKEDDVCKYGVFNYDAINDKGNRLVEKYDIRIGDIEGNISSLSGGNAQKVIIARELESKPKVLICSQPTRGVDIGAIEFIHKSLLEYAKKGNSVLLISSELSEIMSLSDRIVVMYKGSIVGEVDAKTATSEEIGLLMAGIKEGKNDRIS